MDIDKLYLSSFDYTFALQVKGTSKIPLADLLFREKIDNAEPIHDKEQKSPQYKLKTEQQLIRESKEKQKLRLVDARNEFLHYYLELGKQSGINKEDGFEPGVSAHYTYRSVDKDTKLVKTALAKIEQGGAKEQYISYKFGTLWNQVKTKQNFVGGKKGIAPFALANNSQILTTIYEVNFKAPTNDFDGRFNILKLMGMTKLSDRRDCRGNSIFSWLSALINAMVDVAKDPYIVRLNVNEYTYNMLNLFIRTGMADKSFYFIGLPIIKELSRVYIEAGGTLLQDGKSVAQRQREAILDYVEKQSPLSKLYESHIKPFFDKKLRPNYKLLNAVAAELTSVNEDSHTFNQKEINGELQDYHEEWLEAELKNVIKPNSILLDVLVNPQARIDPTKPPTLDNMRHGPGADIYTIRTDNEEYHLSPLELQAYVYVILKKLNVYSLALSDLVMCTRIDTKKQGKSLAEQKNYVDRFNDFKNNTASLFTSNIYKLLGTDGASSFITSKTYDSYQILHDVLSLHILGATYKFESQLSNIREYTTATDSEVERAMLGFYKLRWFRLYLTERGIDPKSYFTGPRSMAARLQSLLYNITNNPARYHNYIYNGTITNALLANLMEDVYEYKEGLDHPRFIRLNKSKQDGATNLNQIEDSWWLMYMDTSDEFKYKDEHGIEHDRMREFAVDLAIYSMLVSADTSGFNKFSRYIPNIMKTDIITEKYGSYVDYMVGLLKAYQNNDVDAILSEDDIDDIILNNWSNDSFVPTVEDGKYIDTMDGTIFVNSISGKQTRIKFDDQDIQLYTIFAGINPDAHTYGNKKAYTINKTNNGNFPRFVKIRLRNYTGRDSNSYAVYKLVGIGTTINDTQYPVYALTYPKGHDTKAGSYKYKIYEYDTPMTGDGYTYYIGLNIYGTDLAKYLDDTVSNLIDEINTTRGNIDTARIITPSGRVINEEDYATIIRDMYRTKLYEIDQREPTISETETTMTSGGAIGSDSYFAEVAKKHGVKEENIFHFYHADKTPEGNFRISESLFEEGVELYMMAADDLGRDVQMKSIDLFARNWAQVKYADAIYAVSFIIPPGGLERGESSRINLSGVEVVSGGTGYAVQMAIRNGKPVYVYNLSDEYGYEEGWYRWDFNNVKFVKFEQDPKLVQHFAGIGSRELFDNGKQAINKLFEDSEVLGDNNKKIMWARSALDSYEVSSAGDRRFSALYARFKPGTILYGHDVSGRTIESVYLHGMKQNDWVTDNNNKTGKPGSTVYITGNTEDASYEQAYLPLWEEWAKQNPELILELKEKANGRILTDKYASTMVSLARALADIIYNNSNNTSEQKFTDSQLLGEQLDNSVFNDENEFPTDIMNLCKQ